MSCMACNLCLECWKFALLLLFPSMYHTTISGKVNIFASFRDLAVLGIIDSDTFRVHAYGDPSKVLLHSLKVSLAAPYIFLTARFLYHFCFSSVSPLPALGLGEYGEFTALIGCGSPSTLTLQAFWWWVRPGSFGVVARSDVGCLPAAHSIRSATPTVFSHTARSHTTPFPPYKLASQ
ncbi:hypothetical protein HOY80DRAFT_158790 [Tuber brumale]|nr:hypothetical protein HOY80DRAFT_158790 [Tuber brumale]